jgi:hypothetical protein
MSELEKFLAEVERTLTADSDLDVWFKTEAGPKLLTIIRKQDKVLEFYAEEKNYSEYGAPGRCVEVGHPLDPVEYDLEPDFGERANSCRAECEEIVKSSRALGTKD